MGGGCWVDIINEQVGVWCCAGIYAHRDLPGGVCCHLMCVDVSLLQTPSHQTFIVLNQTLFSNNVYVLNVYPMAIALNVSTKGWKFTTPRTCEDMCANNLDDTPNTRLYVTTLWHMEN